MNWNGLDWLGLGWKNRFLIHFATIFATSRTNFATYKKMKPMFTSQRRIREFLLDDEPKLMEDEDDQ